ncbi:MAG: hypothetical protein WC201_01350 [Bacilli bacterium]
MIQKKYREIREYYDKNNELVSSFYEGEPGRTVTLIPSLPTLMPPHNGENFLYWEKPEIVENDDCIQWTFKAVYGIPRTLSTENKTSKNEKAFKGFSNFILANAVLLFCFLIIVIDILLIIFNPLFWYIYIIEIVISLIIAIVVSNIYKYIGHLWERIDKLENNIDK